MYNIVRFFTIFRPSSGWDLANSLRWSMIVKSFQIKLLVVFKHQMPVIQTFEDCRSAYMTVLMHCHPVIFVHFVLLRRSVHEESLSISHRCCQHPIHLNYATAVNDPNRAGRLSGTSIFPIGVHRPRLISYIHAQRKSSTLACLLLGGSFPTELPGAGTCCIID